MRREVLYIARHGEDFGSGHFADLKFDTIEEAQAEIERHINGIKSNGEAHTDDEYREYWQNIGKNMYIERCTAHYERV